MYRYTCISLGIIIFIVYTANTITGKLSRPRHSRSVSDCSECSTAAHCVPSTTGVTCICRHGYDGNGLECTDIDECTTNSHSCHAEAWCQNTNGSYECACKQGFYGDGYDCVGLSVDCQSVANNHVTITYVGDARMIYGKNLTGELCPFTAHDDLVTHTLVVRYTQDSMNDCLLKKLQIGLKTYAMTVFIRKSRTVIDTREDDYFEVTCTFDNVSSNASRTVETEASVQPKILVRSDLSNQAQSNFTLHLARFDGVILTTSKFGRLAMLKGIMTPVGNETAFSITNCVVQTLDGSFVYNILENGCGTGYPFAFNKGFNITGNEAVSPTFRLFRITKNGGIMFKCDFVVCNECANKSTCIEKGHHH